MKSISQSAAFIRNSSFAYTSFSSPPFLLNLQSKPLKWDKIMKLSSEPRFLCLINLFKRLIRNKFVRDWSFQPFLLYTVFIHSYFLNWYWISSIINLPSMAFSTLSFFWLHILNNILLNLGVYYNQQMFRLLSQL